MTTHPTSPATAPHGVHATARPEPLRDRQGRPARYLRLAVTDRCNLRCRYCMPAEGIAFAPRRELLTWGEMLALVGALGELGVEKLRITGGEPFARPGLMTFLAGVTELPHAPRITLTTNATLVGPHVEALRALGVAGVNVSLDALERERFFAITRRDLFDAVYANLLALVEAGLAVKVNCVVLDGRNTDQLLAFAGLAERLPISVRFLEEMPFNGDTGPGEAPGIAWDHLRILAHLQAAYPTLERLPRERHGQPAVEYHVPGHPGRLGIVASYSRTFCGQCDRIRVDARGQLRTCLYGGTVASFAPVLRAGGSRAEVAAGVRRVLAEALNLRHADGYAAEAAHGEYASMTAIGG